MGASRTITLLLAAVAALAGVVQADPNRAQLRDQGPSISVTSCESNMDSHYKIAGKSRVARYVETVVVSNARPERKVFLGYHFHLPEPGTHGAKHVFNSNCGKLKHVGLGVATDLVMDIAHLSSGRKLTERADSSGVATFTVPVDHCGKMMYQGFDWINNRNCQPTKIANLHWAPPPPAAGGGAPAGCVNPGPCSDDPNDCETEGRFGVSYSDLVEYFNSGSTEAGDFLNLLEPVQYTINQNNIGEQPHTAVFNTEFPTDYFDYVDYDNDGKGYGDPGNGGNGHANGKEEGPICTAQMQWTDGSVTSNIYLRQIVLNTACPTGPENICGPKAFAQ